MATGDNPVKKDTGDNKPQEQAEVHTNPRLWIKKIRTYAEDLKEAKERAGVKETILPTKKKKKVKEKKKPFFEKKPPKPSPKQKKLSNLDKKYIERELERSGIVKQEPPPEEKKEKKSKVPIIRTFKHDAAQSVKDKHISQVSMAAAEQKRRAREHDFSEFTEGTGVTLRNIALVALSILLVTSGAYAGWYFYQKNQLPPVQSVKIARDVLFTNESQAIDIGQLSGKELMEFLNEEAKRVTGTDTTLVEFNITGSGVLGEREVSKNNFFERISGMPPRLIRALGNDFAIGVHTRAGGNAPFFLLKTDDFETAFAAMLDWEKTMQQDLSPLFGDSESVGEFEDALIRNKDTRLLKDPFFGNTVLLYAFPNTDTIVLTTNEDTFFEIFERLTTANTVRN